MSRKFFPKAEVLGDRGLRRSERKSYLRDLFGKLRRRGGPADKADSSAMMHKEGQWRSSKLIGVDVYNEANEKVGDIE
jgi:hypothetical protein